MSSSCEVSPHVNYRCSVDVSVSVEMQRTVCKNMHRLPHLALDKHSLPIKCCIAVQLQIIKNLEIRKLRKIPLNLSMKYRNLNKSNPDTHSSHPSVSSLMAHFSKVFSLSHACIFFLLLSYRTVSKLINRNQNKHLQ